MDILRTFSNFIDKYIFNTKWTCNVCGKEIFNGEYFCEDCKKNLPLNNGNICDHCGRHVASPEQYCLTCKGKLLNFYKGRSVYVYDKPISVLLKRLKYNGKKYLARMFAVDLAELYNTIDYQADIVTFVPMNKKKVLGRRFNHAKVLAEELSRLIDVPLNSSVVKVKGTKRQAQLNKNERLKNLEDAFRVTDKKAFKEKKVLLIDDVTTTGTTVNELSSRLMLAGATSVFVLTVASVGEEKY